MKNFIKISVIFLASALLCHPLLASDSESEKKDPGIQVMRCVDNGSGSNTIILSTNGKRFVLKEEDFMELMKPKEEGKSEGYAHDTGIVVKGLVQLLPLGPSLTTFTGLAARKLCKTETLTEAVLNWLPFSQTEGNVLSGFTSVKELPFKGGFTITNCALSSSKDPTIGRLSYNVLSDDNDVEILTSEEHLDSQSVYDYSWKAYNVPGGFVLENAWEKLLTFEDSETHRVALKKQSDESVINKAGVDAYSWLNGSQYITTYDIWKIYKNEKEEYVLVNAGADPGFLCYGNKKLENSCYAEIVRKSSGIGDLINSYKAEGYVIGGEYSNSIRWKLEGEENGGVVGELFYDENEFEAGDEFEDIIISDAKAIASGTYRIRNKSLGDGNDDLTGLLSCTQETSTSGFYVGFSSSKGGSSKRDQSSLQEQDQNKYLWNISVVENDYTIQNCAYPDAGFLTWVDKKCASGHYLQVLADNKGLVWNRYPVEKTHYELQNGKWKNHILWRILLAKEGDYTLQNVGLNDGMLGWTEDQTSSTGYYGQALPINLNESAYVKMEKYSPLPFKLESPE